MIKSTATFNQYLLFIFILLSIIVKFYQIDYRSFSFDELYGVVASLEPNFDNYLDNWIRYDTNPPLYYFVLKIWLKIVPSNEFWVRLLSVLFILIASVIFIHGIKKRFENQTWFYLLLLVGANFGFLFFAQEGRAYALMLLFICMQLLCFIDLIETKHLKAFSRKLVPFTVYTVLSSYTHYTGFIFSCILILFLIAVHRKEKQIMLRIFLSSIGCLLLGLFWVQNFIFVFSIDKSFVINPTLSIVKEIVSMLLFGYTNIGKVLSILFISGLAFYFFGIQKEFKRLKISHQNITILGVFGLGIIVLSPIIPYFFQYRHYIFLIPILLLFFSLILSSINFSANTNNLFICLAIVIVCTQGLSLYKSKREEWRQAVKYIVDANKNNKTTVIILGEPWQKMHSTYLKSDPGYLNVSIRRKSFYQYYFQRFDQNNQCELIVLRPDKKELENYIRESLKKEDEVFLLSHAGEYQNKLKRLDFPKGIKISEKKFYLHEVYQFNVDEIEEY
jgi:4-amino-4-deoxy-L-arabinose transferase-like glycosyltransferase